MADAKLTQLSGVQLPLSGTDKIYVVRNGFSYQAPVSGFIPNQKELVIPFNLNGASWSIGQTLSVFGANFNVGVCYVNLRGYTGVNFSYVKGNTAGTSESGAVYLGYSTTYAAVSASSYSADISTVKNRFPINLVTTHIDSGFYPIVDEAKNSTSGVFIAVVGSGGDGTSLAFGRLQARFL